MSDRRHRNSATSVPTPVAANSSTPTLIRFQAVRARTGLSRSTIWRLERAGHVPAHRRISPNAVAWLEQDITKWIESKVRMTA